MKAALIIFWILAAVLTALTFGVVIYELVRGKNEENEDGEGGAEAEAAE